MINKLFRQCLNAVPIEEIEQFEKSFSIAEKLYEVLKERKLSSLGLAKMIGKTKFEIDKLLTGRYYFDNQVISDIEKQLNCKLN